MTKSKALTIVPPDFDSVAVPAGLDRWLELGTLDPAREEEAGRDYRAVCSLWDQIEAQRTEVSKPLYAAQRAFNAQAKKVQAPLETVRDHLKGLIGALAQVRATEAAAPVERRAKALEAKGANEQAMAIRAAAVHDVELVRAQGLETMRVRKVEIESLTALAQAVVDGKAPSAYLEANLKVLGALARTTTGKSGIPGVKFVTEYVPKRTGRGEQ